MSTLFLRLSLLLTSLIAQPFGVSILLVEIYLTPATLLVIPTPNGKMSFDFTFEETVWENC